MARLTIYLPDDDKAVVEERAKAVGLSVSEYGKLAVVQRARLNKKRVEAGSQPGREKW